MVAMLKSLQNHHSHMTASHETALQAANQQISNEAEKVVSQIAIAIYSFATLQNDLVSQ